MTAQRMKEFDQAKRPSPYITSQGAKALEIELRDLWTKRAEVTKHLAAAAAEGDRSENAEYIYRKKELRIIDRRIRYLQKRIPMLMVISQLPDARDRIYFGAWVVLSDPDKNSATFRVVGTDETDAKQGWISVDSPLAKALLKKTLTECVQVQTPSGPKEWTVMDIFYSEPD